MFDLSGREREKEKKEFNFTPSFSPSSTTSNLSSGPRLDLLPKSKEQISQQSSPTKYPGANPTIGENLFSLNAFPIKQNDNLAMKGIKGLGNFGMSTLSAPWEVARKLSLQGGSLLSGNGLQELPKNTSFIQDILPKKASNVLNNFQQKHPVVGGLTNQLLETAVDPTMYLGSKAITNAIKGPTEGIDLARKLVTDTKLPAYNPLEANALRPKNNSKYTFTTGEGRAMSALDEGTQTAQNFIRHNDVLAPYKPGTTLDQAFADIKTNTGVNLPQLTSNWDKAQSLRKSLSPEELRMGRTSGVIPSLKRREGLNPRLGLNPEASQGTLQPIVKSTEPMGTQQITQGVVGQPRQKVGQEATEYVRSQKLTENSDNWKDKKPLSLQTETWDRNIIDIAGPKDGAKIKEAIFTPIHENEANFMRWKNAERDKVASLKLSNKESAIVQQVGEGKLDISQIPQGMDANKIQTAVTTFREIYDNAINLANESLTRNGYKPVGKLENYFPHFEGDDPLMKALGIKINLVELPTDINGLSHQFRPGKNWVGNFLHRTGDKTTFNAVEGFDRYIESVGKVIHHTDDIQRLRALETEIRMKYSPEEIQGQVKALMKNKSLSKDAREVAIDDLLGRDTTHLSNSVSDLREYTNVLAGKKDLVDRAEERRFGRQIYNVSTFIENRIGGNMVRFNPGTWITQFIPVTQALATTDKVSVARAMKDVMRNAFSNDGFVNRSTFLTNRKGSQALSKGITEKVGDAISTPMYWVDQFSSQVVTRAKYLESLKKGMPPEQAMKKADDWAAKLMGDRSVGAQPTIFNQLNPVTRLFTQFQLEVKNQISVITKDLPREYLKDGKSAKGIANLTSAVTQLMVYGWIYNQMFEKLTGRRPALDPIGIGANLFDDVNNENLTTSKAVGNFAKNVGQQVPFVGGVLFNGGRIPVTAAVKPIASLPGNVLKMATDEDGPKEGAKEALGNLGTAAAYIVPPFGGGQVKKSLEAYKQLRDGGEIKNGKMSFPVASTPSNIAKGYLFGPSSFKETRDFYDNARTALTEKQTTDLMSNKNIGEEYLRVQNKRKEDSRNAKLKAAEKKALENKK